ncbi:MAG TPA: LPXTG cell wall anchor domain-containing protein [Pilimelia sp.]|nr:LPXTG cell wall anchor domain-containing protein [Pilimelia sp.]
MSNTKPLVPAAGVATLPVTGTNTAIMVLVGLAVLIMGLLLVRSARPRRSSVGR